MFMSFYFPYFIWLRRHQFQLSVSFNVQIRETNDKSLEPGKYKTTDFEQNYGHGLFISKNCSKLIYKYCNVSRGICFFQNKIDLFTQKWGI